MSINSERFLFISKGLPDIKFYVVHFSGTERLNEDFSFKIRLATKEHSIDPEALIFQPCIFSLIRKNGKKVVYSGRAKEITFEKAIGEFSFITIQFNSNLFFQDTLKQSKIYLDKSLPELIESIMCSAHYTIFPHEIRFARKYPVREFSMQYNETNYNYLRYKLEEQGAYFFFDESGEKIIFADNFQAHAKSVGLLTYAPERGMLCPEDQEEILTSFTVSLHVIPGKVVVRNYDWKAPNKIIVGMKDTSKQASLVAPEIYNDEAVSSQDEANFIAAIRAEQLVSQRSIGKGTSYAPYLHPGVVITINNYSNDKFNTDVMITEITHEGSQEAYISQLLRLPVTKEMEERDVYRNTFTCIKAGLNFHPERKTPRSVISGMINAFIDGDDTNAPVLDEYGRYKVIFPFDLSGRAAGKASCWVRKAQEQVGKDSGMTFPLLPGTEVNISFINGNPDRPVITGALANGETGSLAGPGNKNFSGIRTPGGAQLSFDNDHQGISLVGSGGSGIKLGAGSMSYLQSDTHVGLNIAAQTSSSVAGFCQSKLSGFKQLTAAMCGSAGSYIMGMLSLVCGQSSNILNSLSASSSDAKTANDLSWGASATKMASSLVSCIQQVIMAKMVPQAAYNVEIMATKSGTFQTTQCFPSTEEIVANMTTMLLGSLVQVGTDIADAAKTSNDADEQDTGDVEAYKNKLLEAMRAVYDRRSYIPDQDFEKFKYEKTEKIGRTEDGKTTKIIIPVGEYYNGAQNSPCGYYAVTTEALTTIINAVKQQIDNIAAKMQNLQISLTSSEGREEQKKKWTEELNRELINSKQAKNELQELNKLSGEVDNEYKESCVGNETAADYYGYQKQNAIRNAATNSVSTLLPEIGTVFSIVSWLNQLKTKNIGGVFINAMDKNINLHAATYIGQHAGRGIYLNTLETVVAPDPEKDQCSNWGSPLIAPGVTTADEKISKVFKEIKEEVLPGTKKSVTDFLNAGHKNGRKGGPLGKWGDTIESGAITDKNTSFIAARTHLSYTKATNEFHYSDEQFKTVSPFYMLTTTLDSNEKVKTTFKFDKNYVEFDSKSFTLESIEGEKYKYEMRLSPVIAQFGLHFEDNDDSYHGIVVADNQVAVTQKKTGTKTTLLLEDNKVTLAIGEENHLTLDGAGKKAVLAAPEVQVAGVVFKDGQIKKAKGGNMVFGNNDIKIANVSSVEIVKSDSKAGFKKVKDNITNGFKSFFKFGSEK